MGCKNYSHTLFNFVESWRVQSPTFDDFKSFLDGFFVQEDYEAILAAIEDGTWNEEFRKPFVSGQDAKNVIKSLDDDGFLEEKSSSPNIMSLYQDPIHGGSIAMNKTIREFEDEIVKRLIYDKNARKGIDASIVLPNGVSIVNYKLLEFKKELLQKLWNLTGINRSGNFDSDEEFTRIVNQTLKDFEYLLMSRSDKYLKAYGDYIKLKAFDTLLKGLDFIAIKEAYKDGRFIGANMYDYKGPQMKRDASIGKETAEISDYTGSVVKLLLKNCFRRITKTPDGNIKEGSFITEVSFNRAMTTVILWYMYGDEKSSGKEIDPSGYQKLLNGDKTLDYGKLIDTYLDNHKSKTMYESIVESILNGVREQIFNKESGLTSYIQGCFNRHLQDVFSQVYLQYRINPNTGAIENKETTDYFIELQSNNVENIVRIQTALWRPHLKKRNTAVRGAFQNVINRHNIVINGEEKTVSINGHIYHLEGRAIENDKKANGLIYKVQSKTRRADSPITDDIARELIRDILGIEIVDDYETIIAGIAPDRSLMSLFEQAIAITLAAASEDFEFITYKESGLLNTFYYKDAFLPIAAYLSEIYGEDSINVIKNTEGNALPLYSLGSLSKKLRRIINNLQDSPIAQSNPIVELPKLLQREYVRSQTKIGEVIKDSKNLGPAEIMAVQMLNDFWLNLTKVSETPTIRVMPMTLSDKSTHTLYDIRLNEYKIKGKGLATYLTGIGTQGASDSVRTLLENDFSEREALKIKTQLIGILSAYTSVYDFNFDRELADDLKYLKTKIDQLNSILKTKKNIDRVKSDFGDNKFVDILYCDQDFDGTLSINPQLLYEADIHLFKTIPFKDIVRENKIDFIEDMRSNMFKINKTMYPDIVTVGSEWYDPVADVIEPFLIYDENGNVISDHTVQIDWTKCSFKLHPVMESYFYMNLLINVPLQEIMLGTTHAYKSYVQVRDNKQLVIDSLNTVSNWIGLPNLTLDSSYKEIIERRQLLLSNGIIDNVLRSNDVDKKINLEKLIVRGESVDFKISGLLGFENNRPIYDQLDRKLFYQQSMSLKLNDKMKRALIVGATITTPILDKPYCPPKKINMAICKDFYGFAFNLSGKSHNKEPHDGSGVTHPCFSRAVNFGLFDGAVGKNKKTIAGYLDPMTLVFKEIKWAEFELSNLYRKQSFDEAEMSAEIMFKKMSNKQIPIAKMNNLDISHFYGKHIHRSKHYNSNITHTDDIYFFDPNDGNYYKILSVTSDRNVCTRTTVRVDSYGNHIGKIRIEDNLPMNSIYDLDQIFGGCFCKKLSSDGILIDSDANSDIVYTIVSENDWWDYITCVVANTSAYKTGTENVNNITKSNVNNKYNNNRVSTFSRGDNTELKTIEYDVSNYGAIMDGDHELDKSDNSVKEMGQVIASLIQEGASIDVVNEIYKAIGELAYASMRDFIEAHERFLNGDKEKLVLELGRAVIDAFESRSQNNIALAYAFLDAFGQNTNMPFSSHAVSGVVLSSIGSKLTKLSLKTTYPGIGTIQVPSNGIMKTYRYGGKCYDYEGIVKELVKKKIPVSDLYDVGTFTKEDAGEGRVKIVPSNKTLGITSKELIDFEDTIVIYDGNTDTHEVIKISDVTTRDYYRYRYNWDNKIVFKWTVKSRDLLPQITRFKYNGSSYTAWDLSAYRAMAYATSIMDPKHFMGSDIEWMKNWLIQNYGITDFSEEALIAFKKEQDVIFKENLDELSRIRKGEITSISGDFNFIGDIYDVKTDAAQIILGKRFMKQFGLRKGDDLSKITSAAFFVNRLTQQYALPSQNDIPTDLYDAVLYTKSGEQVLITISNQDDSRLNGTTPYTGEVFAVRGDKIWYKNEEELDIPVNTRIRSKVINGKEYIVLSVNNLDEVKRLKYSSITSMLRYNYNEENVRNIMSYEYDFNWDDEGVVDFNSFDLRSAGLDIDDSVEIGDLKQLSNNDLMVMMRKIEQDRIINNIRNLAESRFVAFKKSLEAIGARIPAQSMQSFMSLEVVGFTESEVNDIYVPFTLTWVAGSDYDIDKVYVMQYTISDDGTLYSNTNLTGFTAEALLEFPLPKNRTFVESIVSGYRITKEDVQKTLKRGLKTLSDAEPIIKVLKQNVEQIIFDSDVDEKSRKRFLRLLNKHEHFRMSEKHKQGALKNFIVHKIVSVIQDPKNQINVLTPVHTNKIKAASKNSALGLREKHLSLLTPTTTMIMQDQNMIGKTSIASSATGEKVYFHVLNYYSTEMMRLRNLVYQEGSVAIPSIIAKLDELTFINPIYSEITLIGNTSVNPLIRALGSIRDVDLSHYSIEVPSKFEAFKNDDGTFNLTKLLKTLHSNSNKTNCSEDNSEMVTTSTDNAKELDLKKINAIPETLDIFTYLISTGVDLKDVLNFMKQPIMKVCVDFTKSSMFMPWIGSWNQFDQVVKFVKNEDSLWGPDSNLFKREITNMIDFWNPVATKYKVVQDAMIKLGIPLEAKVDYKMLPRFMKLFELNIPGVNLQELFLNHLKAKINEAKIRLKNSANIDFDQLSPEDMEQMVTNTTYLDIQKHIDLYKYVKYTVIPKINSIRTILADVYIKKDENFSDYFDRLDAEYQNRISNPLNQLSNILLGVREQKFLGFAFSINKGLATSDFDEYEWVAKFNQRVNTIIYDYSQKPENSSKKFEAFDLLKFIKDEKYRDDQILQMEGMKHTYNVLKVIVEAEHTWNRIKSIGVLRDVVSTIGIFKFERDVVTKLLRQDVTNVTQQHTKRLSRSEWKDVRNYARNVFVWNWFVRQSDLKIDLLEGQIGFSSLMDKEPNVLIESKTMSLDNELGLANFKLFIETELLLYLKEKYKDNQFIQKLITGGITDKSGRVINFLKLPFSLSDVEGNSTYETLYSNILNDFNKIMFDKIEHENFKNHNWTIGDLFFVYNLYVNKESAGSDAMLKLFEDNVLYGNQLTTAKSYYDYLSAIDKWGVMNENNPNGVEIKYQLEDLVYALRYSGEYRASIFGATTLTPNKVEIPNSKSPKITSSPGYFLFNMPYLLNKDGLRFDLKSPTTISVKNMRSKYSPNLENQSTIRTIIEHMVKILGNKANVPIKVVDKFELEQIFGDDNVNVLVNQKGFIKNGIVYINLEEATLDTPIHELAHIICAGMKYSLNSTVRSTYYTLLKQVDDESLLPYLDGFDENDYTNKHLSDIREEKLVRILSAHLKGAFAKEWSGLFTEEISPNDLSSAIAKTLFTILKITDVSEQEFLGETGVEFGRATLETILKSFNSKLFSLSDGWLNTGVVIKSQRVATIKDRLIKLANLTIEGDC